MDTADRSLSRRILAALDAAVAGSHPARGWSLLQDRDAEGNSRGPLPYADEAILEFEKAQERDPDDIQVVHHLAIAHHARAWDYELAGLAAAAPEWEAALACWREVVNSQPFWDALESKLKACDPTADPTPLRAARRNLLEDLLDIHVAFVRHYAETGAADRAASHVGIIKRASMPPAIKRRLEGKVFEAMTAALPTARAAGDADAALAVLERFLSLFPDHFPALRVCAEVAGEQIGRLSYREHWERIEVIDRRVRGVLQRLAIHPVLAEEPLARAALEDVASAFARRAYDRAGTLASAGQESDPLAAAVDLCLRWTRLGAPHAAAGSDLGNILALALLAHANLLYKEINAVLASAATPGRRLSEAIRLQQQQVSELQEALDAQASRENLLDEDVLNDVRAKLAQVQRELAQTEAQHRQLTGRIE